MKIVPYINGSLDESKAFTSDVLNVTNYDRSGFAFSSDSKFKTGSGAYNDDGTLKSNAKVIYVTADTAKSVKADIITGSNGKVQTLEGFQAIINAKQKGLDTTPLDFRIIGEITLDDMDSIGSSSEGLQVKGKNSYSEMNITIEGVGEDATINGFGFLIRNSGNVELRNFGIFNCLDDSVSIDTDNCNLWIHNLDLFYGQAGGASDQAKGDGTIDIKADSQYVTISYNHLFDNGKTSLCGMTSESGPNYITYHHNWFDHSDSRHPRIRTMSVHVYNNYYDGIAKYGVGAAKDSSAFVESNYFRNCKHPMLSSKQGSDIMANEKTGVADFLAKGTFSGQNGGIIKAYNNIIIGSNANEKTGGVEPVYYDSADTSTNGAATQFDAYLVSSRNETVPSSVKALVGGSTYTNFDTQVDIGVTESDINPVENVPTVVTASAGRMNGGDFKWTFPDSEDTNYAVIPELKSAVTNYKTTLVSVGGTTSGGEVKPTESTSASSTTESTTSAVTESTTEATSEYSTESTTEATTEPTTNANKVELGEAIHNNGAASGISVTYDQPSNSWVLKDTSSELAAEIDIPLKDTITSGKVIVKGTATPSSASSKWAFLRVNGAKPDGTVGEIASLATDSDKHITLRTDGTTYASSSASISAGKAYSYEFVIDLDANTVQLTVDGNTYTGSTTAESVASVSAITSAKSERDVTISVPDVLVPSDTIITTESTTEATTVTTNETSSEATTEDNTETSSEVTTVSTGDINGDGNVTRTDLVALAKYFAGSVVDMITENADINGDGTLNRSDLVEFAKYFAGVISIFG